MSTSERKHNPGFWNKFSPTTLPHRHLFTAGGVAMGLIILLSLLPSDSVEANRRVQTVELPGSTPNSALITESASANNVAVATLNTANAPDKQWLPTTLISGDNLTSIFRRLDLKDSDVYLVANAKTESAQLKRLKPGEIIAVAVNNDGLLEEVKYSRSRLEHYLYRRNDKGFEGEKILYQPEIVPTFEQGLIENSLFLDASRAGLTEAKIMELANIFGWDIDFALDIRKGDRFSVLYEEKYLEGEKVGDGNILAASFTNQGKTYDAVLFKETDGSMNYYAPDGKPMRKAFLRAPLDFTRISSNFNLRRKHPIHKKIKAHRGVDYAASRGTPVYAAGNGKVIASGYSKANGNYVFIKHGEQFITKYLHLDKRKVRKGNSVKQRQTIGTVGSTGYATGPHLHYEFLVNGVHRNPRTVKLPEAKPIAASKRAAFTTQTAPLLARLKQLDGTQVAFASPKT
jgi:murein DD-endopeptidase MepM/ murein hydrolase activator NlpD